MNLLSLYLCHPKDYLLFRETMLDPTAVFALLFGSELFEDYIGHLSVASMASFELAGENDNSEQVHNRLKASMFWSFWKSTFCMQRSYLFVALVS